MTLRAALTIALLAGTAAASERGATTADDDRKLAAILAGRTPGAPQACVPQSRVSGPEQIGDRELIYRQTGGRIWRNTLPKPCGTPRGDEIVVVETFGSQLCRQDRFQRVNRNSGFASGYCYLGAFTPYDRVKR